MVERKTWQEFKSNKLLWWVNRSLHIFGWVIVYRLNDLTGEIIEVYPARTSFRGFTELDETEGFIGLTETIKHSINDLVIEVKETTL